MSIDYGELIVKITIVAGIFGMIYLSIKAIGKGAVKLHQWQERQRKKAIDRLFQQAAEIDFGYYCKKLKEEYLETR